MNSNAIIEVNNLISETIRDHDALCLATDRAIADILINDPFLFDLPSDIGPEEVLHQIAVAKGQALTIFIERDDESKLKVIIPKTAGAGLTVSDLKNSLRQTFELDQKRKYRREFYENKQQNKQPTTLTTTTTQIKQNSKQQQYNCSSESSTNSTTTTRNFTPPPALPLIPFRRDVVVSRPLLKISWRYIWKTYVLTYNSEPLLNDKQSLSSFGIVNKSHLRFAKLAKFTKRLKRKAF